MYRNVNARVRRRPRAAFSLIEVAVALFVAALLCGAVASGLLSVLRSEDEGRRFGEAALWLRTVEADAWLGTNRLDRVASPPAGWTVARATLREKRGRETIAWDQWRLVPTDRPTLRFSLTLPAESEATTARD